MRPQGTRSKGTAAVDDPNVNFADTWFRFVGQLQLGQRRHAADVRIGVDERGASVWFSDLIGSTFTLAATTADPAVVRFFLRCYVSWHQAMDMQAMGESRRRKVYREVEEKSRPRARFCPDCNALGEVFIIDHVIPCPRCEGTGYLR